MEDERSRVNAFSRRIEELTSTRCEPWRFGTVCRNDDYPGRWDSNFLRVERPVGDATAAELAAEADRALGDLRHREIVVEDEGQGARMAAGFGALGWEVDHLLYMARHRPSDREPAAPAEELTFDQVKPLILEINRRGHGGMREAEAAMLADFRRVLVRKAGARFFGARVDRELAGTCEMYCLDGVAQIEDVHTLEEHRGRGLARAFVGLAVSEASTAGADLVFLITDENDWVKQLYRKLGFDPVGRFWQFTRLPMAGSSSRD
jgi:ribosomal protein S18 acetylase RimI-like enzyme